MNGRRKGRLWMRLIAAWNPLPSLPFSTSFYLFHTIHRTLPLCHHRSFYISFYIYKRIISIQDPQWFLLHYTLSTWARNTQRILRIILSFDPYLKKQKAWSSWPWAKRFNMVEETAEESWFSLFCHAFQGIKLLLHILPNRSSFFPLRFSLVYGLCLRRNALDHEQCSSKQG